jgi:hypothetical protein
MPYNKKAKMPGDPGWENPKFGGAPVRNKPKPAKGTVSIQPVGKPKPVKKKAAGKKGIK